MSLRGKKEALRWSLFPPSWCLFWVCFLLVFLIPKALLKRDVGSVTFHPLFTVPDLSLNPMEMLQRSLRLPKQFSSKWIEPPLYTGINQNTKKRCVGLRTEWNILILESIFVFITHLQLSNCLVAIPCLPKRSVLGGPLWWNRSIYILEY